MKKPPPGHNAQKRPDFKGFHGSIGPSGWAVKALFLYEDFAGGVEQGGDLPLTILSQRKS